MTEWLKSGTAIEREFDFDSFAEAMGFVNRVAEVAEAANHHPDILIYDYKHVRVTLTTHDAGGVTDKDRAMAAAIDDLL